MKDATPSFSLDFLAFGDGRRRSVFVCGSLYPVGHFLAALCYNHVKVRVGIFEQRRQWYKFY